MSTPPICPPLPSEHKPADVRHVHCSVLFLDEDEIKKEREKYKTFLLHYGAPEIDHLLEKAQANMRNNRDRILEQIIMAIQRRKKRMSVAQ
jgi:hypothetical protein